MYSVPAFACRHYSNAFSIVGNYTTCKADKIKVMVDTKIDK